MKIGAFLLLLPPLAAPRADAAAPGDQLESIFANPPAAVRPSGYWWWFNNLVDKAGITRDLEEFKAKGLGGVLLICSANGYGVGPMPNGPTFLSPEWLELYRHALKEAARLQLEVGVNFCPGWDMGGPWITPENSGRWFLQSQLSVTGPQKFSGPLPLPGNRDGYDSKPHFNTKKYLNLPFEKLDYRDTAIVAFREPESGASKLGGERNKSLPAKSNRQDANADVSASTVMGQTLVPWTALPDDQPTPVQAVVDLTAKVHEGRLDWEVPAGTWTVVRTGHRMTGQRVNMEMPGSVGYEVDWLSAVATDQQFEHLGKVLLDAAGPLAGKTLRYFHTDSFEDGYPNWTATMLTQFKKYRGYDATPYLPVFAGRMVGSAEISDRFLHDYRKTVADCMADNNYGRFAELSHRHGLEIQAEAAGPSWSGTMCMDALKNLGRCDRPMGEFWQDNTYVVNGQNQVGKTAATAAHIYGRKTASAEAFTSLLLPHWGDTPAAMKPIADRAFCEGINRFVFCLMTATRPSDGLPGFECGAGTHFNPNVTWWQMGAGPLLEYVNRCQALLQSGLFVADVLYYNGDWAPNLVEPKHVDPSLGQGYDYDVCNAEVLLTRLSVKKGRIVLPDGMSYRLLMLPEKKQMPLEAAQKIKQLVAAGATVVGPRPESDPGLKNYPACDAKVKKIGDEVWSDCDGQRVTQRTYGKGRVIWGKTLREILLADGIPPDFSVSSAGPNVFIDFIHRTSDGAEIYFLANRNHRAESVEATFRVAGKKPELWNAVTGERRDLAVFSQRNGVTRVPLEFEPDGSMFIVFHKSGSVKDLSTAKDFTTLKPLQEISGPWMVQFDPQWFYPTDGLSGDSAKGLIGFEQLDDWSKRPEPAVRHFSGTAVYEKTFTLPDSAHSEIWLDLGEVRELAEVTVNGQSCGVSWCAPWRVNVTGAVKPGANQLQIEVVNCWPNRLVGDAKLPKEQRQTHTNVRKITQKTPLMKSGLLGPVRLLSAGHAS